MFARAKLAFRQDKQKQIMPDNYVVDISIAEVTPYGSRPRGEIHYIGPGELYVMEQLEPLVVLQADDTLTLRLPTTFAFHFHKS